MRVTGVADDIASRVVYVSALHIRDVDGRPGQARDDARRSWVADETFVESSLDHRASLVDTWNR